ncbi:hypothetical protein [Sphingobium fuliginis]|uniref:Cupin domain-containing protein n=1 Tax=Sphingobium fuliginis ATCC 27551 TaxID=1208342 RepID=A0A5B8CKA7_SPHSA|nr:hypothetical protein [Sphingobium fuliginis]QDC37251.1 hypothetical protein FIL70_08485 [Sphingobium fuliginis ATCC 27551]
MDVVITSEVPILNQTEVRPGSTIRQVLLMGDTDDGLNFRLFRSQYQSGDGAFESPRHRHAFQQIRWTESGLVNYGPGQDIPANDIAYFPRGAYYGPQRKEESVGLLLQLGFHGEHQSGPRWDSIREEAVERLKQRGRFEDGTYIERDEGSGEERRKDAAQALYEERFAMHTNRPFVVPQPRYEQPVLMHVDAFEYYSLSAGVEVKQLGDFNDNSGAEANLRISALRFSGAGGTTLARGRGQVGWAKRPGLRIAGHTYPEMTCFYCPRGEEAELSGDPGVEVFIIELPQAT